MTVLFSNSALSEYRILDRSAQLHFFRDVRQHVSFSLEGQADFLCAVFLDSAEIDLEFLAREEGVKARIFAFLPAREGSYSTLRVHTKL